MITFAEIRDGETFVCGVLLYMKIPEAPVGRCDSCGVGINALTLSYKNGSPLKDRYGFLKLPWGVHFCPGEQIDVRCPGEQIDVRC